MRLRLSQRGVELSASERALIEQAVRLAMGRHAVRVASAAVQLLPSPRIQGAGRVCCRMRVRGREGRSLLAEEHAADAHAAAFGASARLAHRLDLERSLLGSDRTFVR